MPVESLNNACFPFALFSSSLYLSKNPRSMLVVTFHVRSHNLKLEGPSRAQLRVRLSRSLFSSALINSPIYLSVHHAANVLDHD